MAVVRSIVAAMMLLVLAVILTSAQDAPAGAPALDAGCLAALVNVSDCLTYLEEGSNLTAPGRACCPEMAGLVESKLTCLCELMRRADGLTVKINASRILELPSACDINTPPPDLCSGARSAGWDLLPGDSPIAPGTSASLPDDEKNGNGRANEISTTLVIVAGALAIFFLVSRDIDTTLFA